LYRAFCFKLFIDLIGPQVASGLMHHSLWLPYFICIVSLSLAFPFILWMPETLHIIPTETGPDPDGEQAAAVRTWSHIRRGIAGSFPISDAV
jgi:hypothetical protein